MLMSHVSKPSLKHCSVVAKSLIVDYPFLKDNEGDGEVNARMHVFKIMCCIIFYPYCFSTNGNGLYTIDVKM